MLINDGSLTLIRFLNTLVCLEFKSIHGFIKWSEVDNYILKIYGRSYVV